MSTLRHGQTGFTLIEVLIVVAIFGILAAMAVPFVTKYRNHGEVAAVVSECRSIYTEFELYYEKDKMYPDTVNLKTLSPIDWNGNFTRYIEGGQIDLYSSPDDSGVNQEFWLRMTLASNPTIQFVVSRSDNVDLEPGRILNGAFLFKNGKRQ